MIVSISRALGGSTVYNRRVGFRPRFLLFRGLSKWGASRGIERRNMEIEKPFGSDRIVTFESPIKSSKLRKYWVCVIGGIEFSGENKLELMEKAIQVLKCELAKLEVEYDLESKKK